MKKPFDLLNFTYFWATFFFNEITPWSLFVDTHNGKSDKFSYTAVWPSIQIFPQIHKAELQICFRIQLYYMQEAFKSFCRYTKRQCRQVFVYSCMHGAFKSFCRHTKQQCRQVFNSQECDWLFDADSYSQMQPNGRVRRGSANRVLVNIYIMIEDSDMQCR